MENGPSKTALLVSAYRARGTKRGLCADPWAEALAGAEGQELAGRYEQSFPHMELWMSVRTAFFDAELLRHTTDPLRPVRQVVILGAGLDTRAARLARPEVRFFEVDHPLTQADKLRRISTLEGYPSQAATYVSCDFETQDFLDRLVDSGFRTEDPALILWEGVVYYLEEALVRGTLHRISSGCHGHTTVIFDYLSRKAITEDRRDPNALAPLTFMTGLGERVRFGSDEILPLLYEEGFRHLRTVSFDEACLSLTGTYQRERKFRFQQIALTSRLPPDAPW